MVQSQILHVNGDDPEAVTFACKLATEYRQTFKRDVVIDMWCYRRFGHNEGAEPSFTQPLMYDAIRKHPSVSAIYADRLAAESVVDKPMTDEMIERFVKPLDEAFEAGKALLPNKTVRFQVRWSGPCTPAARA